MDEYYRPRLSEDSSKMLRAVYQGALEERQRFDTTYKDVARQFNPSLAEWDADPNSIKAIDLSYIYDPSGWKSSVMLANAMHGYSFGRHTPWLRLATEDPELMDGDDERDWLQLVEDILYKQFAKSGFYEEGQRAVRSAADFGTAITFRRVNAQKGVPSYETLKIARCALLQDEYGMADTLFYETWLRAPECVKMFGKANLPDTITDAYTKGGLRMFRFVYAVFPYAKFEMDIERKGGKQFCGMYFCMEGTKDWTPIRHSGYDVQPFFAWRWGRNPDGSAWGCDSPGFLEKSNSQQLQGMRKEYHRIVQLKGRPPIKASENLNGRIMLTPNGVTLMRPGEDYAMQQIAADPQFLLQDMTVLQNEIKESYYNTLFLVLTQNLERAKKTATEVEGIRAEQSALLTAITGRQMTEYQEPAIEDLFALEMRALRLPPPPQSMRGKPLKVDLVSPLAILQKQYLRLNPTRQALGELMVLKELSQDALDHYDLGKYGRLVAEVYNTDRTILRNLIDVERIRKGRAEQAKAMMEAERQSKMATAQSKLYGAMSRAPEEGAPTQKLMAATA